MKQTIPVILNVYKIKEESFLNYLGLTFYHTAIEYDDCEYAFGFLDENTSGIYSIKPMSYDEGTFHESIILGYTDRRTFFKLLDRLSNKYIGRTYNIIIKNCNHFTNNISNLLFKKDIPIKYNKLLQIGEVFQRIF